MWPPLVVVQHVDAEHVVEYPVAESVDQRFGCRQPARLGKWRPKAALLQFPFLWYGRMFLRVSQAVSRSQEYAADQLAARTVGAKSMIEGLRALSYGSVACGVFWQQEVAPLIEAGYQPPIVDGFSRIEARCQFVRIEPLADWVGGERGTTHEGIRGI